MPRRDEFAIDGWVVSGYRRRPRYRHRGGRPGWEERRRVIFSLERSGVEPGRPGGWMLWQKEQDLVRRIARKVQDLETVLSEYYIIVERFNAADADKQGQYRELLNRRRDKVKRLMRQLADWYSRKASMGYTRHKLEVSWRYWDPAWKDRIESWREKEHGLLIYGQDYLRKIRKAKRRR